MKRSGRILKTPLPEKQGLKHQFVCFAFVHLLLKTPLPEKQGLKPLKEKTAYNPTMTLKTPLPEKQGLKQNAVPYLAYWDIS